MNVKIVLQKVIWTKEVFHLILYCEVILHDGLMLLVYER